MKIHLRAAALGCAALWAFASAVSAQIITYEFEFVPEQNVVTNATGFGIVTLNPDTFELTWDVTFENLTSGLTAAHFHGPAGPDSTAGVLEGLNIMQAEMSGMTSGSLVGETTTNQTATDVILDGMAYINLHTEDVPGDPNAGFPGGEIRGQVVPEPRTYALIFGVIALGGAMLWRRRRARGIHSCW